ncbi:MAG: valine--tRNA ligase, partial [Candidatus Kariarchaeaceae archaeon]
MTEELSKTYTPSEFEDDLYKWWMDNGYFKPEKLEELGIISEESPPFINTIPPPNVTGVLHLGHAITIAIQDLVVRYKRMKGYRALFVPGSDHAGIATQNVVERELNKQGIDRKEMGREKFLEEVWKWKEKSHKVITQQSMKLGLSSDWDREAFTMDDNLSKAVREAFVRLYEKDLIYRGNYLVNWCPGRCESAISDLEAEPTEVQGYLWYIKYPVKTDDWDGPAGEWGSGEWAKGATEFIEVATTRPETLLGDTAVAIAKNSKKYKRFEDSTVVLPVTARNVSIVLDDYVDEEFGTGAVKITPAHDFNDYLIGQRHDLDFITMLDEKAVVLEGFGPYSGMDRFEAREAMVADLEKEGLLVKTEDNPHSIPHCQRCHTIVEPRDSIQWFVRASILTKQVLDKIEEDGIEIIPESQMDRLQQWLDPEFIRDWCISRQLWWGHRIPVWYCSDGHNTSGREDPTECGECGKTELRQDPDVLDTWFSSALWPFSTLGWPEKTADMSTFYPNQLRETGYDILFFWVARELMMGVELTGQIPYETVYFHGLVRNEVGKKISKSMENIDEYDPLNVIAKHGADALRYTLIAYSTPGLDMNLDPKNIEATQKFGNKLWNMVKYVLGNIPEGYERVPLNTVDPADLEVEDRWILTRMNEMVRDVIDNYDDYSFLEVARDIKRFAWNVFADWYIEISKIRIYDEGNDTFDPTHVLLTCIDTILRCLHPIMPYISEKLWQALPDSYHDQEALMIASFPKVDERFLDSDAADSFDTVRDVISTIRTIRGEYTVAPSKTIGA